MEAFVKIFNQNHNYPFGLKHNYNNTDYEFSVSGSNVVLTQTSENKYNYQYNGKEFQDELGLNWYDYGARNYDASLGRWMNMDPLAEKNISFSTFAYTENNPINMFDPDGKDGIKIIDCENKTITIKAVFYVQSENRSYPGSTKMKYLSGYSENQILKMNKIDDNLNELNLTIKEGDYKDYTLKFDLDFREGGTVAQSLDSANKETFEGVSIGNSLTIANSVMYAPFRTVETQVSEDTTSQTAVGGITDSNKHITMNKSKDTYMNRLHEIFHVFGFEHPEEVGGSNGIMKYPPEKPNQNDANYLLNNNFLPTILINNENE